MRTSVERNGRQLLFCKLFSFWQRKKLIKLPIFCDEILSEATKVTSSRMTVVGGGLCADGGLCGFFVFTREINDLPYKRGWAVRIDGAMCGFFGNTSSTANAVPLPPLGKANEVEV